MAVWVNDRLPVVLPETAFDRTASAPLPPFAPYSPGPPAPPVIVPATVILPPPDELPVTAPSDATPPRPPVWPCPRLVLPAPAVALAVTLTVPLVAPEAEADERAP